MNLSNIFKDSFLNRYVEKIIITLLYYSSKTAEKMESINQINEFSTEQIQRLIDEIQEHEMEGSGLIFLKLTQMVIQTGLTKKSHSGCYIPTPKILYRKKAIVNIKNDDDRCIDWSLLAHFNYDDIKSHDKNVITPYKKYDKSFEKPKERKYIIDIQTDIKI
jgi:hypothetical protein